MFGNTLALIYYDKYLIGNKLSLDDKQIEALDYAFSNMSPSVNIIFVCRIPRDEYKKPDSRKKLYKVLSKHSQVQEFAQYKGYDKKFPPIIVTLAKEKGCRAIRLNTTTRNLHATHLYKKNGFTVAATKKILLNGQIHCNEHYFMEFVL